MEVVNKDTRTITFHLVNIGMADAGKLDVNKNVIIAHRPSLKFQGTSFREASFAAYPLVKMFLPSVDWAKICKGLASINPAPANDAC